MKEQFQAYIKNAIALDNAKQGQCQELLDTLKVSVGDQSSIAQDTSMLLTIMRHHHLYLSGERARWDKGIEAAISTWGLNDRIDMMKRIYKYFYDRHHSLSSCHELRSEASGEASGASPVKSSSSSALDQGFGLSLAELKKRVRHTSFTSFDKSQLKHVFMELSRDSNPDDFRNSKSFVALFTIPGVDSTAMMSKFLDVLKEMSPVYIVRSNMEMPREVSEISDVDMCALGYKEGFLELAGDQREVFLRKDLRLKQPCVVSAFEVEILAPFTAQWEQVSFLAKNGRDPVVYGSTSVLIAWDKMMAGISNFGQFKEAVNAAKFKHDSAVSNAAKAEHDSAVVVRAASDTARVIMIEKLEHYRDEINKPGKRFSRRLMMRLRVNPRKNLAVEELIKHLKGEEDGGSATHWSEFYNGALLAIGTEFIDGGAIMSDLLPFSLRQGIQEASKSAGGLRW